MSIILQVFKHSTFIPIPSCYYCFFPGLKQIDALPAIVKQVDGRCRVYVDGGITRGTDILKAIALGADMVYNILVTLTP